MSYILDALKKIEHEKNKRNMPGGRLNISGDLFLERKQPVKSFVTWKVMTLVAAVALLACAGTWFALQGVGKKRVVRSQPVPAVVTVQPTAAAPVAIPVQVPTAIVAAPVTGTSPPSPAPQKQANVDGDDERPVRGGRHSNMKTKNPPDVHKQVTQTVQAPADIKLSGIAWQDERAARRAVVNGFLLKEGAVVSGAKVIDIQSDKVRFSGPSGLFDIKLDGALPVETPR